jgi:aminoglycoside phosphotransferase family enzyme/predicted kinase
MSMAASLDQTAADPRRLRDALGSGRPPRAVEVRETHISWVFLVGDHAYKLKKPVVLDFVDYGTPARRRAMCHEELGLNARLAPDLYLAVKAVAARGDRLEITDEIDPAAVDYVVEMRRYDEHSTLAALADRGQVTSAQMVMVGECLAAFHAGCRSLETGRGSQLVRRELDENLSELAAVCADPAMARSIGALGRFLGAFAAAHQATLDERASRGLIREGHGDLRAEHVVTAPRLSIVDCVEFDPGLRTLDVADDLAFLVMDLCAHGAEPAARELIAAYRNARGDCGREELVWFFAVHRALIRAKVALVRSRQATAAGDDGEARRLVAVAERCAWRARGAPTLVVCGVPASGKSHLADALGAMAGCPVLSSDVVRKELGGLAPHDRGTPSLYTPEVSARVYRELGRRSAAALAAGHGVLVDATFRRRADRDAFRVGWGGAAPVTFVQCVAPAEVLALRARTREQDPARISDAGIDVVQHELARFEPLDEADPSHHLLLRTDRGAEAAIADLLALLDLRLLGN